MQRGWLWLLLIGIAWIILVPARLLLTSTLEQAQTAQNATAATQGKVVSFDPDNHNTGTIEYWVAGVRYEGGSEGMDSTDLGTSVPIHYNPHNPAEFYVGDSPPSFKDNLTGVAIVVLFFLTGLLLAVFGSRRVKESADARRAQHS